MKNSNRTTFTTTENSLGFMLVAASEKGISSIHFFDDEDELIKNFLHSNPYSIYSKEDQILQKYVSELNNYISSPTYRLELPLDICGTPFEIEVWSHIKQIPLGTTLSYTELAIKMGRPKSFRAVANACGSNSVAILIPCHRVISKNGSLSGYRWGKERKEKLIQAEREVMGSSKC